MVRTALAVLAIAAPLALLACGGDDDETTGAAATTETAPEETTTEETTTAADEGSGGGGGAGGTVTIRESEYKLDPADPTVKAGEVTFDVTNVGSTIHDLEVEGDDLEQKTDPIEVGDTARLAVDLEPGTYEIYCTIGDHADHGMEGTLTVE